MARASSNIVLRFSAVRTRAKNIFTSAGFSFLRDFKSVLNLALTDEMLARLGTTGPTLLRRLGTTGPTLLRRLGTTGGPTLLRRLGTTGGLTLLRRLGTTGGPTLLRRLGTTGGPTLLRRLGTTGPMLLRRLVTGFFFPKIPAKNPGLFFFSDVLRNGFLFSKTLLNLI